MLSQLLLQRELGSPMTWLRTASGAALELDPEAPLGIILGSLAELRARHGGLPGNATVYVQHLLRLCDVLRPWLALGGSAIMVWDMLLCSACSVAPAEGISHRRPMAKSIYVEVEIWPPFRDRCLRAMLLVDTGMPLPAAAAAQRASITLQLVCVQGFHWTWSCLPARRGSSASSLMAAAQK